MYSVQLMHLFRGVLLALSKYDSLTRKGMFAEKKPVPGIVSQAPKAKIWRQCCGDNIVMIDSSGWNNAAKGVSHEAFAQAQLCAANSAKVFSEGSNPDAIHAIFMSTSSLIRLYDNWTKVFVSGPQSGAYQDDLHYFAKEEHAVKRVCQKALGDRATLVRVIKSKYRTLQDANGRISRVVPERGYILVACRLDGTRSLRSVDIGPAANDTASAKAFRAFWGEKSELRRFQDGKIAESVVWANKKFDSHNIVSSVLKYTLSRHISNATEIHSSSYLLDGVLKRKDISQEDEVIASRSCIETVNKLGKMLKSLDDVTLEVVNTQPLSPVTRHTAVCPPIPHPLAGHNSLSMAESLKTIPRCLSAVEILCQLEGSGKWPDGPAAYQKMKAAIGVQLAQALKSSYGVDANAAETFIDVFLNGFAYRLILYSERDILQLKKRSDSVAWTDLEPQDDLLLRQWHQGFISAVAAEHPSFETAVRYAKVWTSKQWLAMHIKEEAIELITAAAYTKSIDVGGACPCSPVSGFLGFLDILSNHPWDAKPLVLDTSKAEEAGRMLMRLKAVGKAPAMFIAIEGGQGAKYPVKCVGWTQNNPTRAILFRARVLANKALSAIKKAVFNDSTENAHKAIQHQIFSHNIKEYEILLYLRKDAIPKLAQLPKFESQDAHRITIKSEQKDGNEKLCRAVLRGIPRSVLEEKGEKSIKKDLLVDFDPLYLYVSILNERFGPVAVICADTLGGDTIGIKLRPKVAKVHEYDPDIACSVCSPVSDRDLLHAQIDLRALALDAIELGSGLVEYAHVLSPDGINSE